MEGWGGTGPIEYEVHASSGAAHAVPSTPNPIADKLEAIGRSGFARTSKNPKYVFDKTLLSSRPPLTGVEIEYVNLQLTNAVRAIALQYGCAPDDVAKIDACYWHEKHSAFAEGNHVWGIFYDCGERDYDDNHAHRRAPMMVGEFMRHFERALGAINFDHGNTKPKGDGMRHAVGFSMNGWNGNYALMRGASRDALLPIVKLVEQLDPEFKLRFDAPEQYTSIYDSIRDGELQSMAQAPESCFWIDRQWAQEELNKRESGREWREMQERIQRSRVEADAPPPKQSLAQRLKIALTSSHIHAVGDKDESPGAGYGR